MNRSAVKALGLAVVLTGVASCDNWLVGPGLTENPNSPVAATPQQQLIAVQASAWTRLEGQLARNASIWTQQIIGTFNQQLIYATQYNFTESDVGGHMTGFYTGGGLVGLRNIQAASNASGDALLEGIATVWEGFQFGMAASIWGDLPYSEAVSAATTPVLDPQQALYAAIQTRLDEGITLLNTVTASTAACEPADVIYCTSTPNPTRGGQAQRWIRAANSMKARFHLHLAERNGAAAYTAALAAANAGINEAPTSVNNAIDNQGPGDFRSWHSTVLNQDGNMWGSFLSSRAELVAGDVMIQILGNRDGLGVVDPRRARYFNQSGGLYLGHDRNNAPVPAGSTASTISTVRTALAFRQPIVTWAETQLIIAEANCAPNVNVAARPATCTGNAAAMVAATNAVNAVRTAVGLPAHVGPVTYTQIMEEKYVTQFQNIDVWNDYKRSCVPSTLRPYATATEIPGRMNYALGERSANPNIPAPNAMPTGTTGVSATRNWNDPFACP